jgi:hypothetical protein
LCSCLQGLLTSGLVSREDTSRVSLVPTSAVRQAEGHAYIAVWRALAPTRSGRPKELVRRGSVEPWDVDADPQPPALVGQGNCAWWCGVAFASHCPCLLKILDCVSDELLSARRLAPSTQLRETRDSARLQMVPERLSRDVGQVRGPPGGSPQAWTESGAGRAPLCERGRRPTRERRS